MNHPCLKQESWILWSCWPGECASADYTTPSLCKHLFACRKLERDQPQTELKVRYIRGPVRRWLRGLSNVEMGIMAVLHFRDPLCPGDELLWVVPLCSEQHQPAESRNTSTSLMKTRSKPEFSWKINKPTSMTSSWPPNEVLITRGLAPLLYHNALSQGAGGDNTQHKMQIQKN